jgi:hypothetical protein
LSPFWDPDKRRKLASGKGTPKHYFSIEACRRALAKMVIVDKMPFNVVEGEGFKEYIIVTPPVTEFLIIFFKLLIKHKTLLVNEILGKIEVLSIKLKLNLQEQVKNS